MFLNKKRLIIRIPRSLSVLPPTYLVVPSLTPHFPTIPAPGPTTLLFSSVSRRPILILRLSSSFPETGTTTGRKRDPIVGQKKHPSS